MLSLSEVRDRISGLEERLVSGFEILDIEGKEKQIRNIEEEMQLNDFWQDKDRANKVLQDLKGLRAIVGPWRDLEARIKDLREILEIVQEDPSMEKELLSELERVEKELERLEHQLLFSGRFDSKNAILEIQSGAGGTEACDWAGMLMRMYQRWAERKGYEVEIFHILPGEEAGVKSVSMLVKGPFAYGHLKAERGVHRLVRISPFDANKRRHTSFASVDVVPEMDEDIEIELKEEDLRIDVFRSTGPGGQSVNTTDSAVRVVHIPTGIVVTCRNERSQLQNKQTALRILKARLYELEEQKRQEEIAKERGEKKKIEWGSQIRSYVMQPYTMVKDHRTGMETSNVQDVLDGGIDEFIYSYLKQIQKK